VVEAEIDPPMKHSAGGNGAELVVASLACYYGIAPMRLLGDVLIVATALPLTEEAETCVRFIVGREVRYVIRSPEYIAARQRELYGQEPESGDDSDHITWYWPHWHWFDGNELHIKCSGWDDDGTHWSGCQVFASDHPDYEMWRWIISIRSFRRLLEESEMVGIRRIWTRYLSRCKRT
jgi:hypothetical protein